MVFICSREFKLVNWVIGAGSVKIVFLSAKRFKLSDF